MPNPRAIASPPHTSLPSRVTAPWGDLLRLSPLFGFFALASQLQAKFEGTGDGWRYLLNARHILDGYFAGPDTLMFWNGPGYPLFLAPFLALGIPMAVARLANAVFLSLAVAHFQGVLRVAGVGKRSLAYAYGMGILLYLHGPLLGMIMTESLSVFLICGAAWHGGVAARGLRKPGLHAVLAGLHLGYLALTKVFFGYVLEAALPLAAGIWWWSRRKSLTRAPVDREEALRASRSAAIACAVGLAVCVPWLGHTWSKTGKANLWGNSGGFQLYFMSLPEKEYFGDWINFVAIQQNPEFFRPHAAFIGETLKLDWVAQDGVFKREAMRHCREHPGKCFQNWRANINRMAFGFPNTRYPGSEADLTTGNRAFIYGFPFFLCLLFAAPGWLGRRRIPAWAHACLVFAGLSLGGMSLVCAIPRQVFPVLPLLGIWIVLVAELAMEIRIGRTKGIR